MRIMIKGGVWKNTEDEILKAAVMKYGKNQWARISSLLVRKSAKQCKARWYEWLDPSIKKTEWTREEDEKLLHLAKLMPTQWRTIAPIVGRTPSQCLERYEKLLDAACVKDENYEPNDDPRKLRPGEIDPNPESKPARPDPVDMDEDEKEMLSEARARLANTRGKKAKRKAREKQLEEARRLASLQKRRELKAAGIDNRQRKRKRKGIDYNAEIPFEKKPPPGFFDVADEDRAVEQPKFPTTIEELEGKRRVDMETQLRKQDVAKNKIVQRQDAPSSILQVNRLNDPEAVRKRSKLMLPAPQISDHELEEIAKMGYASDLVLGSEELAEGSGATRALLANYSQTPRQGMTPLRTPQRTPGGKGDAIMMEAENLARLRESQTPLLGGENPELHPSDFSGVTPKKKEIQTPNPIATPLASPGPMGLTPRIGMTPSRDGYSFGMTPKGTPLRDELHINEDMDMHDSAKLELRRQAELRRNLRSGLTNLPQPKNEYQIVMQPIPQESEEPEEKIEEDMSDRAAREKAEEDARLEALLRKRSKVLQRELPRPPAASLELLRHSLMRADEDKSSFAPPTLIEQADEMIKKELLALLEHDNSKYPLDEKSDKEKKKGTKRTPNGKPAASIPEIEDFEEDVLKEADSLIMEEVQFLRVAMGHEDESLDEFIKARDACQEDLMYFPNRSAYALASVANNSDKLLALQNDFENVKMRMDDEAKKAQRLEQKIKRLTHGYQMRAGKLGSQIEATFKQMDTAGTEVECFQALQKQEQLAASYRINGLVEEVNKQKELERNLQHRYGNLTVEQDRIQRLLEDYKLQLQKQEEIIKLQKQEEIIKLQKQEEIMAKNRMLEVSVSAAETTEMLNKDSSEPVSEELPISIPTVHLHDEAPNMQVDVAQDETDQNADASPKAMEIDKEHNPVTSTYVSVPGSVNSVAEEEKAALVDDNSVAEEEKATLVDGVSYLEPIPGTDQFVVRGEDNPNGVLVENPISGRSVNSVEAAEGDKVGDSGVRVKMAGEENIVQNSSIYIEPNFTVEDHYSGKEGQNQDEILAEQSSSLQKAVDGASDGIAPVCYLEEKTVVNPVDQIQVALDSVGGNATSNDITPSSLGGDETSKTVGSVSGADAVSNDNTITNMGDQIDKVAESVGDLVDNIANSEEADMKMDSES
ncbi:cell division cycle 5 [Tasmannia lanceolata]|uniref:cell division cycle 5 n=1 Tax=Tasmannia lanceolata TaxID=3420 RepID=UPI004062F685